MNRMSIAGMVTLAILTLAPQKAEAQFFKKLEKAINKVLDATPLQRNRLGRQKR